MTRAPLRIMMVADAYPPDNNGGAARAARMFAEELRRRGCEVTVVTHGKPRVEEGVYRVAASPVGFLVNLVIRAGDLIERFRPDVIELTGPVGVLLLAKARLTRSLLPPTLAYVQGLPNQERATVRRFRIDRDIVLSPSLDEYGFRFVRAPLMVGLDALRARWCTEVACDSHAVAAAFVRMYDFTRRASIVYSPVDTDFWHYDPQARQDLRNRLGLLDAEIILYAGVFRPVKGLDVLLRAMVLVTQRRSKAVLLVAGGGRNEPAIRQLVERLGLQSRVRMVGWLDSAALVEHFSAADVVAVPSRYEAFGLSAVEAMACQRCVVASHVGGLTESVCGPQVGWSVPPADPAAMAEAICDALADPARRTEIGRAARQRVQENFTLRHLVDQRLVIYERLIAQGPVRKPML